MIERGKFKNRCRNQSSNHFYSSPLRTHTKVTENNMDGSDLWTQSLLTVKTPELRTDVPAAKDTCQPSPDSSQFSQYAEQKPSVQVNRGDTKDFDKQRSHTTKSNKSRSSFSLEQILHLERVFEQQKYLGSRDRQRIAEQLQMTETQVKTWFQNRRMKQKRKRAEDVERRAKLSFISSLAYTMNHGYHGYQSAYEYQPPSYPDTPLVLRSDLNSKYACPPALPWSSLPPYPPPPYWGRYPGTCSPQLYKAWQMNLY